MANFHFFWATAEYPARVGRLTRMTATQTATPTETTMTPSDIITDTLDALHADACRDTALRALAASHGWEVAETHAGGLAVVPAPSEWTASDGQCHWTCPAEDPEDVVDDAMDAYEPTDTSYAVTITTWRTGYDEDGEEVRVDETRETRTVDPDCPDCEDHDEHGWEAPHSVVGGDRENPGCWGSGHGSVRCTEVCRHCGVYRTTDHGATNMSCGAQVTTVTYRDADDVSGRYVDLLRVGEAEWEYKYAPTPVDDTAVGCELVAADGEVLASCLWSDGELDLTSDGCGVDSERLTAEDIDWPDEDTARDAVWG